MPTSKKKVKSEGEIQTQICKWLRSQSAFFWRNNTTPTFDKRLNNGYGGYRGMGTYALKGVPDIICIDAYGNFVGIEVKSARGKLSPDQILFKKRCERHSGQYYVVTTLEELQAKDITYSI